MTKWRRRAGVLVSLVAGPLTLYFALPIVIPWGLPAVLITIFLVTAEVATGLFLGYEGDPRLWIESLALSGAVMLVVGLIFSTPLSLELKLWIGVLVFVSVSLARLYYAKRKRIG